MWIVVLRLNLVSTYISTFRLYPGGDKIYDLFRKQPFCVKTIEHSKISKERKEMWVNIHEYSVHGSYGYYCWKMPWHFIAQRRIHAPRWHLRIGSCSTSSHGPTVPTKGATVGLWNCSFSCRRSYQHIEKIHLSYVHSTYICLHICMQLDIYGPLYIFILYMYVHIISYLCVNSQVWCKKTAIRSFFLAKLMLLSRCPQISRFLYHTFSYVEVRIWPWRGQPSKMPYITMCQGGEWMWIVFHGFSMDDDFCWFLDCSGPKFVSARSRQFLLGETG